MNITEILFKITNKMDTLNEDVLLILFSFFRPEDIYTFYKSCHQYKTILDELLHHSSFIVKCNHYVKDEHLFWFQLKNIKIILLCEYKQSGGLHQWFCNGKLHRDNDLPALVHENVNIQKWYRNGKLHRYKDKPAVIINGTYEWYLNGKRHRNGDKPACIWNSGTQEWYQFGQLHRDNDLPALTKPNGTKVWYQNGKRHRDGDEPAEITPCTKRWFKYGKEIKRHGFWI
jgi:hypothetical protein